MHHRTRDHLSRVSNTVTTRTRWEVLTLKLDLVLDDEGLASVVDDGRKF